MRTWRTDIKPFSPSVDRVPLSVRRIGRLLLLVENDIRQEKEKTDMFTVCTTVRRTERRRRESTDSEYKSPGCTLKGGGTSDNVGAQRAGRGSHDHSDALISLLELWKEVFIQTSVCQLEGTSTIRFQRESSELICPGNS